MARIYNPEWLQFEKELGMRPVLSGSVENMVGQYNSITALAKSQLPAADPSVTATDHKINKDVTVRVYRPEGSVGKLPVCIYSHGGGWCLGGLENEDALCRAFAQFSPCIVVSIDYRLAPMHKMPTMVEDCMAAWEWAWNAASELGGDQKKYFTAGGSAGGTLSLSIAERLVADGKRSQICGIIAMVPATLHHSNVPEEYASAYTAMNENAENVPIIDRKSMETFYHAVDSDSTDPVQFPALSKNLASFPPTYIATCEFDPLRDDGKVMELALMKAGVRVLSDHYEGYPHYFWIFACLSDSERFVRNVIAGIHFVLAS